jgi:hypothetical protein
MPRPKKEYRFEGPRWTNSKGWVGRVWLQGDKPKWSGWLTLGTTDREHARKLLEGWAKSGIYPVSERGKKSFTEEAERILADKEAKAQTKGEKKAVQYRRDRLRKYALPIIGHLPVGTLEPSNVAAVLDKMAADGAALRTTHNLRSDISVILSKLVRDGEMKMNPAKDLALPDEATVDTRERMHLSDEQMMTFQTRRGFASPLDMNVMLCRCVSAQRTSDGHAGDWSNVDRVEFAWMKVRRPKTDGQVGKKVAQQRSKTKNYEHVIHKVHEQYRPALRAYWESQGRPEKGPLFPLLRDAVTTPMKLKDGRVIEREGGKAGGRKGSGTSYAKAYRAAVWDEEIYAPMPAGTIMADGAELTEGFDPANPDPGKCFFQTDTATTRRLTFHGIRADLNSALMEAGTTDDQRILLMGHTQATTGHKHYMRQVLVEVPSAALPGVTPDRTPPGGFNPESGTKPLQVAQALTCKSSKSLARPGRFERPTFGSVERGCASKDAQTSTNPTTTVAAETPREGVSSQALGRNSNSPQEALEAALEEAAAAVRRGDWERADQLRALLAPNPPKPPVSLALVRARKEAGK